MVTFILIAAHFFFFILLGAIASIGPEGISLVFIILCMYVYVIYILCNHDKQENKN